MRTRDQNKEEALRRSAMEIVVKSGLDGLTMQQLSKQAGVSAATIYIYFKDRDDLIMQICTRVTNDMLEFTLRDFDPEMHFEEGLRIQWENRMAYLTKYPLEMEFIEQIRYSHLYHKVRESLTAKFGEAMGRFMNNAIKRKELARLPFEVYWSVAFAPLYQLMKFHSQERSFVNEHFAMNSDVMMKTFQLVIKALTP
jgi:AcrR family transcriptional regulator